MYPIEQYQDDTTDYEGFCEVLKHIDTQLDIGRWQQGDYVLSAIDRFGRKIYGENLIEKLSMDTQIAESTLKLRRKMSKFYPPEKRQEIPELYGVNYSVMEVASRAGKTVEEAQKFLDKCKSIEDCNTVKQYVRQLQIWKDKPPRPKKLLRIEVECTFSDRAGVMLNLRGLPIEDQSKLESGKCYIIDIWECKDKL